MTYAAPHHLVADGPALRVRRPGAATPGRPGPAGRPGWSWACPASGLRPRRSRPPAAEARRAGRRGGLPHPPLLVPQLAAGAAGELDDLRAACDAAVRPCSGSGPERVVLAGAGPGRQHPDRRPAGSLATYGVPLTVLLGGTGRRPTADLPLALTIGAWLLQRSRWAGAVSAESLPAAAPRRPASPWARRWPPGRSGSCCW